MMQAYGDLQAQCALFSILMCRSVALSTNSSWEYRSLHNLTLSLMTGAAVILQMMGNHILTTASMVVHV